MNHIALVVSDVGRSLTFYTDVVGMKQVLRPNFDRSDSSKCEIIFCIKFQCKLCRHGAWLTFGNVDLHLIKGRPAVHPDDDLIVSHLALTVSNMPELRQRFQELNIKSRRNVSVPNPATEVGIVDQVQEFCKIRLCIYILGLKCLQNFRLLFVILMATTLSFARVKLWKSTYIKRWRRIRKNITSL